MVVPSVLNPTILDMVLILTNRRCHGGPSSLLERLTVLAGAAPGGCRRGTSFLAREGAPPSRHLLFLVPRQSPGWSGGRGAGPPDLRLLAPIAAAARSSSRSRELRAQMSSVWQRRSRRARAAVASTSSPASTPGRSPAKRNDTSRTLDQPKRCSSFRSALRAIASLRNIVGSPGSSAGRLTTSRDNPNLWQNRAGHGAPPGCRPLKGRIAAEATGATATRPAGRGGMKSA